ncbi:MAG: GxxExxY protein [Bacteroidia bacterium]
MITQEYVNNVSYEIVGCAIEVHRHIGPGLLESVYEECLIEELKSKGLKIDRQSHVPISYKGKILGTRLKLDLVVNNCVIVELKSVDTVIPVYKAQLLSYLKLTGKPKGLLINFNCENITRELIPLVTDEFSKLPKS